VSSDTWVEELLASRRENRVWHDGLPYDAVIVETSANDVVDLERHDRNVHHTADMALSTRSARYTELLINLVLSHGNTSVIYLGASTHGNGWMGERPRMSDAVEAQLPVAIHYRIPYVSVIDAIGPLRTTVAKEWYNNDFQPYRGADKLHASNLGHELISTLLSDLLLRHAVSLREPFATAFEDVMQGASEPYILTPAEIQMYLAADALYLSLTQPESARYIIASSGFAVEEDVKGKPGLLAHAVGNSVTIGFAAEEVAAHAKLGWVHLSILRSYAQMGTLRLEVKRRDTDAVLNSALLDGLWEKHVSEVEVEALQFDSAAALAGGGLKVVCTVAQSSPARSQNKAKLIAVSLL